MQLGSAECAAYRRKTLPMRLAAITLTITSLLHDELTTYSSMKASNRDCILADARAVLAADCGAVRVFQLNVRESEVISGAPQHLDHCWRPYHTAIIVCVRPFVFFLTRSYRWSMLHVGRVASACFCRLCQLRQIRRCFGFDVAVILVVAFVMSRLDFCNSVFAGLPPRSTLAPLHICVCRMALCDRFNFELGPRDHITDGLLQMRCLPIYYRVTNKLCGLMYHNSTLDNFVPVSNRLTVW